MSLSPRPERFRITRSRRLELRERSMRPASACADSSAGMMPSVRARSARGVESGFIGDGRVFGAMLVGEPGVLGADGGIVESRGNGMRRGDLAVVVLQDVSVRALQHAGARAGESLMRSQARGMFAESVCRVRRLRRPAFSRSASCKKLVKSRWHWSRRQRKRPEMRAGAFPPRESARALRCR